MTLASVLFFPQRPVLRLDGRAYSPNVVERVVSAGGMAKSYQSAGDLLSLLTDIQISTRQVGNLVLLVGEELRQERDARTLAYQQRPLPNGPTRIDPSPALACVEVDGGRMQTRTPNCGKGVHDPHWRESKNAGFFRMTGKSFSADPQPTLPTCFSSKNNMSELLHGLEDVVANGPLPDVKPDLSWRPEPLFRTCLASLENSTSFGAMMSAEADRRGFYAADRRAFLGDGLTYNWTIHQDHFPTFTPILDFIHPIERLHEVSKALNDDATQAWNQCIDWMQECWQGNVEDVIGILQTKQLALGEPPDNAPDTDSRVIVKETITYLTNNTSRMDYPAYRRKGLPITSCLIESLVKEMNHRVKGTEKFWNDAESGEAILQIRAALLSGDDQIPRHFQNRPGNPYTRKSKSDQKQLVPVSKN